MAKKRDTFMSGRAPYQVQAADIETAKHLRNMAGLYVRGKVLASDVQVAITEFEAALKQIPHKERKARHG